MTKITFVQSTSYQEEPELNGEMDRILPHMNYMSVALKFVKIQKMKLTGIICKNTVKNKSDIKMKELLKSSSFSLEIGGFRMKLCSLILATCCQWVAM